MTDVILDSAVNEHPMRIPQGVQLEFAFLLFENIDILALRFIALDFRG